MTRATLLAILCAGLLAVGCGDDDENEGNCDTYCDKVDECDFAIEDSCMELCEQHEEEYSCLFQCDTEMSCFDFDDCVGDCVEESF